QRAAVLVKEVLLLEAEPDFRIVRSCGAPVRRVRRSVWQHYFAQNDVRVLAGRVRIKSHRLQDAVGLVAFGLHCGAAVKTPKWQIGQCGRLFKLLKLSFTAQFGNGLLTIKPDVFKFVLSHGSPWSKNGGCS